MITVLGARTSSCYWKELNRTCLVVTVMNSCANNDFSFRTERLMHLNFSRSFQLLQRKVHCENLHLSWMHGRLRFFISPISIGGGLENSCHRCEFVGGGGFGLEASSPRKYFEIFEAQKWYFQHSQCDISLKWNSTWIRCKMTRTNLVLTACTLYLNKNIFPLEKCWGRGGQPPAPQVRLPWIHELLNLVKLTSVL